MYTAGRVVAQLLPNFTSATLRFAVASLILVALAYAREDGLPRLDRRRFGAMLALALTGAFAFNAFFFASLERIPAGIGALIQALNPVGVAVGAWLFYGDRMTRRRWLGLALALAGATVVVGRGELAQLAGGAVTSGTSGLSPGEGSYLGELLMLGSVLSWVAYTLIGRTVLVRTSSLGATTWAALFGTVLLGLCAAFERPWAAVAALPAQGWVAVGYLGAFGTVVAFLWYNQGVQRLGPTRAAVFINLVPVFGVAIAAVALGEPIVAAMVVGGLMVIGGVLLVNRPAGRG
jgi:drug/metabolite transporter (DMT)-like permease